jgi:hypothetical protein
MPLHFGQYITTQINISYFAISAPRLSQKKAINSKTMRAIHIQTNVFLTKNNYSRKP